jgi:hypothetical protein
MFRAVYRLWTDQYRIIEGEKKANHIHKSRLIKVERNGFIGATGYYHVLIIPHQSPNKLASSENFRFWFA